MVHVDFEEYHRFVILHCKLLTIYVTQLLHLSTFHLVINRMIIIFIYIFISHDYWYLYFYLLFASWLSLSK